MATCPSLPIGTPLIDVHNTFGAAYIGTSFSIGLLGMTLMQGWFYYGQFPNDPVWIKIVVAGTCIMEFMRSTFNAHAVYYYLVQNYGNRNALDTVIWSFSSVVIMTNISELFGHFYFSWRIYMLSPRSNVRYALTTMVVIFTLVNFGMGTAVYVNFAQATSVITYSQGTSRILVPIALSTAVVADVSIAGCLIFVLNRSKTGFSKTNHVINTLIFYAIQVGAITVVARFVVIALNRYGNNPKIQFDYVGPYDVVGNLYANSLLASLNSRRALKADLNGLTNISTFHATNDGPEADNFFTIRPPSNVVTRSRPHEKAPHHPVHLKTFVSTTVEVTDDQKHAIVSGNIPISPKVSREPPESSLGLDD